jgi:hypothetical protein
MPTTGRGYVYPASTDHDRIWEHIQNLATSVDTDISALTSAWTDYTPTWTSTGTAPALGNGTLTGRYKQIGKLVTVKIKIVFGSTTTFGTGGYLFSLPVTAGGTGDQTGSAYFRDTSGTSSGHYNGISVVTASGTTVTGYESTGHAQIQQTLPVVWANTDFFVFTITYEAA